MSWAKENTHHSHGHAETDTHRTIGPDTQKPSTSSMPDQHRSISRVLEHSIAPVHFKDTTQRTGTEFQDTNRTPSPALKIATDILQEARSRRKREQRPKHRV